MSYRAEQPTLLRTKLALAVSSSLLTLAIIVLGAELWAASQVELPGDVMQPHLILNHRWVPGQSQTHDTWAARNPRFPKPYIHHYNAQGWVEENDIEKEKPANTFRIFYLGDSFIEGTVPMAQNVPSVLL